MLSLTVILTGRRKRRNNTKYTRRESSSDNDDDDDLSDDSSGSDEVDSDDSHRERASKSRTTRENNKSVRVIDIWGNQILLLFKIFIVNQEKSRASSPRPSTSKASVPRNRVVPKKEPVPKTAHTAKMSGAVPSTSADASTSKGFKIKVLFVSFFFYLLPKLRMIFTVQVSEQYKLSEWLSETRPRKSPYYPQIHDEIVYFVQGWWFLHSC